MIRLHNIVDRVNFNGLEDFQPMLNPSFILDYLSKNKCHVLFDKEKKKVEVTKETNY